MQSELDLLDDEAVLEYIVDARGSGDAEAAKHAIGLLAFRNERVIRCRVAAKLPPGDVDDVVMDVLESVVSSAFQGKVLGELHGYLRVICARRVADHLKRRERRPPAEPLPDEDPGEDGVWGEVPSVGDGTEAHAIMDAVHRVLARRNERHKLVIRLYAPGAIGGADLSAAAVGERVAAELGGPAVSADNVAQIWRRFRTEVQAELEGDGGGGGAPRD